MSYMFQEFDNIEYLDLSNFDTSNVINMEYIYNKYFKLIEINRINKFKTNKYTI